MSDNKDQSRNVAKRHEFADYLNVQSEEVPNFALMGTGFTTLDENPGAQTSKKKYVNEAASSSSITRYETVFPFTSDLIIQQEPIIALYNVGRNHCTGSDAEFQYVRVELWDKVPGKENEFAARLFKVSAEITSISGEDEMAVSGNLNAVGDPAFGTFNTVLRKFTPLSDGDIDTPVTTDPGTEAGAETETPGVDDTKGEEP